MRTPARAQRPRPDDEGPGDDPRPGLHRCWRSSCSRPSSRRARVHLDRKRLLALADLAAASAADAVDESAYYSPDRPPPAPGGTALVLTEASVRRAVSDYLASTASPTGLVDVRLVEASTTGGTVTITLHAVTRPALLSVVTAPWSDGIDLFATASATTR